MNIRTITCWAVYDPQRKVIFTVRALKKQAKPIEGCILVKMKGHYLPPKKPARTQSRGGNG